MTAGATETPPQLMLRILAQRKVVRSRLVPRRSGGRGWKTGVPIVADPKHFADQRELEGVSTT